MLKTQGAYGSFEKAITALMKRKPIIADGFDKGSCEKYFGIALKVVGDALEFENNYIRSSRVKKTSSGWIDRETILKVSEQMETYLEEKNPDAPSVFIERSIGRITYYYHLA
jgi:hypothetical protein